MTARRLAEPFFQGLDVFGPLLFWPAVALPLGVWASPLFWDVSWPRLLCLLGSMALALHVARRRGGRRGDGTRVRAFLASGAFVAVFQSHFHANELAGVLLLYLPLTLALALCPALAARRRLALRHWPRRRALWQLQLVLLALLFGLLLARTGSRGGFLAAALALAAVLGGSGTRGRRLLAAAVLGALLVASTVGVGRIVDAMVFQGSSQGFSPNVLLTGRLSIWHRAGHALADFPVTGLGLGVFGAAVDTLYPSPHPLRIEDAHNLFLQTALDLGIPGLAAFLVFLGCLARRLLVALRRAPRSGWRYAQLLGLAGGFGAHLLYSLTDSVSLGSPGGVAFWFFCGLAVALTRDERPPDDPPSPVPRRRRRVVAMAAVVLLALAAPWCRGLLRYHRAAVAAAHVLVGGGEEAAVAISRLEEAGTCRAQWLLGLVAERYRRPELRDAAWARLVVCSRAHFGLLEVVTYEDQDRHRRWAELAVTTWVDDAEAHFWSARTLARNPENYEAAVERYRSGLALDPAAARAWLELGDLLAASAPEPALGAYAESCRRGDPGANACFRAGLTAERLGDAETAIRWYRASRWGPSRARGDELERGGGEQTAP